MNISESSPAWGSSLSLSNQLLVFARMRSAFLRIRDLLYSSMETETHPQIKAWFGKASLIHSLRPFGMSVMPLGFRLSSRGRAVSLFISAIRRDSAHRLKIRYISMLPASLLFTSQALVSVAGAVGSSYLAAGAFSSNVLLVLANLLVALFSRV